MTVFLLSPAYCGGRRAAMALRPGSELPLAKQLGTGQLDLGSAFSFFSGLYFRGKLSYARRFGTASGLGVEPVLIITPTRGLMSPAELVTPGLIREFASVDVSEADARYRVPLERDVATLALRLPGRARAVLLGSVASGKYVDVLRPLLGERLCYPTSFIGRGDMSRGGLLLRCVASGEELDYEVLAPGMRPRGSRPPKLDPASRPQPQRQPNDYRVNTIYKIVPERLWSEAATRGSFGGSPVDLADGFLHFSTASQVRDTAAKHFAGVPELLIVAVSTVDLGQQLRWEPSRGGDLFPHLYAELPMTAVRWVEPLLLDAAGRHVFPTLVGES